jgi:hypothetical protein
VRLNVDLDVTLTVIANGCYRWLASRLNGFEKSALKQLYRRFVETAGTVRIENDRLIVGFDRRSHNPILREASLDRDSLSIPGWVSERSSSPIADSYSRPRIDYFPGRGNRG